MLDQARSENDINVIKDQIRQTLHDMEQASVWAKSIPEGGNKF